MCDLTKMRIILATLASIGLFGFATAIAGLVSVNLAWNQINDPDVTGYNLYWGETAGGRFTNSLTTAGAGATVPGLTTGTLYSFKARSLNTSGLESEDSNVVAYQPPPPTNAPPKTNYITITPQRSQDSGPWAPVQNWPSITVTNPQGVALYRLDIARTNK